jgi:glycosyltransferase involved in cell wall biosynthesis
MGSLINGVNIEDYPFSVTKTPFSLIYIGRLTELKGVTSLVECIPMVRNRFPEVKLHIVGDGPRHEEVRRTIEALQLSQNVFMHGYVSEREKIELLSSCAVYVSNSVFEGFGIPLVEAMATGTVPVVKRHRRSQICFPEKKRWLFSEEYGGNGRKN